MSDSVIQANLRNIQESIRKAAVKAGRAPDSVRLVAVSKFHPADAVIEAVSAGQSLFGENRVQEAAAKFDDIRARGYSADLHIIGSLQRNKVKDAVRIASCIQSVDRPELMAEIEKQCAKIGKTIDILFELHTGEDSKSGFPDTESIRQALSDCAEGKFPHLAPKGFMTMAPNTTDKDAVTSSFVKLRTCAEQMQRLFPQFPLTELSMGMSQDYEIAIAEGATMVRIGTAIFGERSY